mmetsp:Transcript_23682/g.38024  ORF Transcript_23682/g.38024 Transcript_23682/m.38024 type:complete len:241 (+) Transcript_23682:983-1705(+)|eukprot:jgi/Bigna1/147328/aug1.141_g22036
MFTKVCYEIDCRLSLNFIAIFKVDIQSVEGAHPVSEKEIVIGAGEGTTGTHTVAELIHQFHPDKKRPVVHWNDIYGNFKEHSQKYNDTMRMWRKDYWSLITIKPEDLPTYNFTILEKYAGMADSPFPQLFPYIYRQFPNAKVILSIREPFEWVSKRMNHEKSPIPFADITMGSHSSVINKEVHANVLTVRAPPASSALLFSLHNALIRCMVRPGKLLVIDLFREDFKDIKARVKKFLHGN